MNAAIVVVVNVDVTVVVQCVIAAVTAVDVIMMIIVKIL